MTNLGPSAATRIENVIAELRCQFDTALEQGNTSEATELLRYIENSGAELSPIETLFRDI